MIEKKTKCKRDQIQRLRERPNTNREKQNLMAKRETKFKVYKGQKSEIRVFTDLF